MIDRLEVASLMPPIEDNLREEVTLNLNNQSNFSTRPHHAQSFNSSYHQLQVRGLPQDLTTNSYDSEFKVRRFTDDKKQNLRNSEANN
jgi:hypothetical protein